MKLKQLDSVLYSSRGDVQMGVLYNINTGNDISSGTVDYIVSNYPNANVYRICANKDEIVIYTDEEELELAK